MLLDNMPRLLVFRKLTHLVMTSDYNVHYDDSIELEAGKGGVAVNLITSLTNIRELSLSDLRCVDIGFEDFKVLAGLLASSTYIEVHA